MKGLAVAIVFTFAVPVLGVASFFQVRSLLRGGRAPTRLVLGSWSHFLRWWVPVLAVSGVVTYAKWYAFLSFARFSTEFFAEKGMPWEYVLLAEFLAVGVCDALVGYGLHMAIERVR